MHRTHISSELRNVRERDVDVACAAAYCRARRARLGESDPVLRRVLRHVEESSLRELVGQCQPKSGSAIAKHVHALHILSVLREGIRRSGAVSQPGLETLARERIAVIGRWIDAEAAELEHLLPLAMPTGI